MLIVKNFSLVFIGFIFIIISCVPVTPTGSSSGTSALSVTENGVYQNQVFDENIKTVQIYRPDEPFVGAVIPLSQEARLRLVFDILERGDASNYDELFIKIIHCNSDWRQSQISPLDFLSEFNEFRINEYEFSVDTKIPYTQYQFMLPRVKMPGNYIALIYRNRNESDVLFTHRFLVYQNTVAIGAEILRSSGIKERETHHQIEFVVNYSNYNIPNPQNDVQVVLRQNQCWYNAIEGLRPTQIKEVDKVLEYRHFTLENNFAAGNEYRYFDLRLTRALGQNVGNINRDKTPIEAYLLKDESRLGRPYSQYEDINGYFAVGTTDTGTRSSHLEADYIQTHFFLESAQPVNGDVYITGEFNNRVLSPENQMKYDAELKGYMCSLILKQGFYNYQYYVANGNNTPSYHFEGSHDETENQYEILIYHRPLGARADLLVGYKRLVSGAFRN